jgi:hypothetical protein
VRTPRQLILGPRATTVLWLVPENGEEESAVAGTSPQGPPRGGDTTPLPPPQLGGRCMIYRASEVEVHQALLSDVIHGLQQQGTQIEPLFADERWKLV